MSVLSDLLAGQNTQTNQSGTQTTKQSRLPTGFEKLPLGILLRAIIGQMVNPPNTAISVPTQQALSALQGGGMGMANAYGIGGGQGQTEGLQTRAQMGLPDRSSYFGPFMPTTQDIQNLGLGPLPAKKGKGKGKANKEARQAAQHPGGA